MLLNKKIRGTSINFPFRILTPRHNGNGNINPDKCLILTIDNIMEVSRENGKQSYIYIYVDFTEHDYNVKKMVKITPAKLKQLELDGKAMQIVISNNGSGGYDKKHGAALNFSIDDCITVEDYL